MVKEIIGDHVLIVGTSGVGQAAVADQWMKSARCAFEVYQADHFQLVRLVLDADVALCAISRLLCV